MSDVTQILKQIESGEDNESNGCRMREVMLRSASLDFRGIGVHLPRWQGGRTHRLARGADDRTARSNQIKGTCQMKAARSAPLLQVDAECRAVVSRFGPLERHPSGQKLGS